ncbi:hypothetical protein BACI9J_90001 [Bacillus altitudinis]|nr:hypothetical protein BACI9J_90001 [Bacillus altitudinis]
MSLTKINKHQLILKQTKKAFSSTRNLNIYHYHIEESFQAGSNR